MGIRRDIKKTNRAIGRELLDMGRKGPNIKDVNVPYTEQFMAERGNIGDYTDPSMSAARQAQMDILQGGNFADSMKGYTADFMDYVNKEVLPAATFRQGLRGSGYQNIAARALSQSMPQLLQQAGGLAQQAQQNQYGMAQFLPQQQLAEQGARQDYLGKIMGMETQTGLANQAMRNQAFANRVAALSGGQMDPGKGFFGSLAEGIGGMFNIGI